MNDKKYYLGLDIGTSSVGFAVTDDQYNLIRKKGKHLWGSRLFDEANTAEGRRLNRSNRRRLARRRQRIGLLRELFAEEIFKIDSNFYNRLDYSAIHVSDKEDFGKSLLQGYMSDKQFYKKYPTIYHLRDKLLTNNEKADIREIYLAFAHMIKYRGNFLHEGEINNVGNDLSELIGAFDKVNESLKNISEFNNEIDFQFHIDDERAKKLYDLFKTPYSKTEYLEKEKEIFGLTNKQLIEMLSLINGGSRKAKALFKELEDEEIQKFDVGFEVEDFEAYILASNLDDSYINLLLNLKKIYDIKTLVALLKNSKSLSEAMVNIYKKHKTDLYLLKGVYKDFVPDKYNVMFVDASNKKSKEEKSANKTGCSYSEYVGRYFTSDRKRKDLNRIEIDELYKRIKSDLNFNYYLKDCDLSLLSNEELLEFNRKKEIIEKINKDIEDGNFLRIQNNKSNGVIPYQLNKNEMMTIIEKQGKYYPFLLNKATSFINPKKEEYKLISLLEYKIPYYVGPLKTTDNSKNSWIVRKEEEGKITPWNFYSLVDESETAKNFINRMKIKCTYLNDEDTLPKNSLLNLQFQIFNELNNVYLGENKSLTFEDKKYLFENVYKTSKKVTVTNIKNALKSIHKDLKLRAKKSDDEEKLTDILKTSYSSYFDLSNEKGFGKDFDLNPELFDKAEKVIMLVTLFEEKSVLKNELAKLNLNDEQIKYFASLSYKGWGRYSKKLLLNKSEKVNPINFDILSLSTINGFDNTKEHKDTIFNLVKYTSENFMQVLNNSEYGFVDTIQKYNNLVSKPGTDIFDQIDECYASPSVKRSIRQTIKIVQELKKILKIKDFDRIFVECTREKQKDPKKKDSRRKKLEQIYKEAEQTINKLNAITKEELESLKKALNSKTDDDLRGKKLFYYFAQFGHDVYTGEPIKLNNLNDYDIDHIIPQAMVKDDSFTNKVLVKKSINNLKSNTYPFGDNEKILTSRGKEWVTFLNRIHDNDLMTSEKMNRIIRTTPLSNEEMEGFINRQLTTTNQSVKAVCDILKKEDKGQIVYSKASLVSEFRNEFDLVKVRQLNNLHHANDAYLNIVVGNVYYEKFNNLDTKKYIEDLNKYNDEHPNEKLKLFTDVKSIFEYQDSIPSRRNDGTVVWYRTLPDFDFLAEELRKQDITDFKGRTTNETLLKKFFSKFDIASSIGGTIEKVRKTLSWHDPMVTHMVYTQTGKQGFFNKITIKRAVSNRIPGDNDSASFPLKKSSRERFDNLSKNGWEDKYGGYSDLISPYYYIVKSQSKKGEEIYSLETIPSILASSIKSSSDVENYLANVNKLINPKLVFDYEKKLLINTKICFETKEKENVALGITGRSKNSLLAINLNELFLKEEYLKYYKLITKLLGLNLPKNKAADLTIYENDEVIPFDDEKYISKEKNIEFYNYLSNEIYSKEMFAKIPGSQADKFKNEQSKESFSKLSIVNQVKVLHTMIELLKCTSVQGKSLKILNPDYPGKIGIIQFGKNLKAGTKIVGQSYTGFYETVIFKL